MEILILIIAILIGLIPASIAKGKGRSFGLWWFYGAALFIIALPHALIMKANNSAIEQQQLAEGMKKCPHCAELIKPDAKVCRYCGRDVAVASNDQTENNPYHAERNTQSGKYQLFLTNKYSIQKNATLEKYIIDENLFETLEDALQYANEKDTQEEQEKKQSQNAKLKTAFFIKNVADASPAEAAGIKANDILLAYAGAHITSVSDLLNAISSTSKEYTSVIILRERQLISIEVKSGRLGVEGSSVSLDSEMFGARVKELWALDSVV